METPITAASSVPRAAEEKYPPAAHEDAAQDVPAVLIGPQEMSDAGRLETVRHVLDLEPVRGHQRAEKRHEEKEEKHERSAQRRGVAPQATQRARETAGECDGPWVAHCALGMRQAPTWRSMRW